MKKTTLLLLALVFVFGACSKTAQTTTASATPNVTEEVAAVPFDMVIIETPVSPGTGMEDPALTRGLEMFAKAPANITKVDYALAKDAPEYAGLDMSYMPLYLIKKNEATMAAFNEHIKAGYIKTHGDFIVFERQTRKGIYMDKKLQSNTLEIFVMSQCPYGAMAENKVIDAQKAGKIGKDIKIKLRYIVTDMGNGDFRSLHGPAEWEENVRQLIIQKYYPSKLWKYLEERNKNYISSRWDVALKAAGIPVNNVTSKWDEGVKMLQQDAKYSQEFRVSGSPSFLWEGRTVLDFGSVGQVKGLEFLSPTAPGAAPGAPAVNPGSC
ncbi:hypothetical protein AAIR98_001724 [Elusimicrobium simillimum]|uniref:hypothetical protein n=1 Tax=Elusimicrobium simillimum TaxID=3143438 RepID=UPI003C6F2949